MAFPAIIDYRLLSFTCCINLLFYFVCNVKSAAVENEQVASVRERVGVISVEFSKTGDKK